MYDGIPDNLKIVVPNCNEQQSTESVRIIRDSCIVLSKTLKAVTEIQKELRRFRIRIEADIQQAADVEEHYVRTVKCSVVVSF